MLEKEQNRSCHLVNILIHVKKKRSKKSFLKSDLKVVAQCLDNVPVRFKKSMLFGGGDVLKAPMDVRVVAIFVFFCNFLGGGLAEGAFFFRTLT